MTLSYLTGAIRTRLLTLAISAVFGFVAAPVLAAGDSDSPQASEPTQADSRYGTAKKAIEQKRYDVAIPILEAFINDNPRHAGAHNYLAFAHRKQGRLDVAYKLYQTALELDPKHRGAHEYLGELYLQRGDLASAEAMLKKLDGLCFFGCEEYDDLKKAIAEYRAKKAGKS